MKKRVRIPIAIAIGLFGIIHQWWLFFLFPSDPDFWLAFFLIIPLFLFIATGVGVATFFALGWARSKKRAVLVIASFLIGIVLTQILAFPGGSHYDAAEQMRLYIAWVLRTFR